MKKVIVILCAVLCVGCFALGFYDYAGGHLGMVERYTGTIIDISRGSTTEYMKSAKHTLPIAHEGYRITIKSNTNNIYTDAVSRAGVRRHKIGDSVDIAVTHWVSALSHNIWKEYHFIY